ncbi:MAG: ABC transporter ATP-binding protein [Alphaproteobacteria bacterium]
MSPALAIDAVSVRLGGRTVVDRVSLTIPAGHMVALIGPNGAGKTTLLRAAAGALAHDGAIRIAGRDAIAMDGDERARVVAYMPQGREVAWAIAVRELVALGRLPHRAFGARPSAADRAAVDQAIAAVDLAALAGRPATRLSEGERARALRARTQAQATPIQLVDEPTAAHDPNHQLQVMEILRARADAGAAVVVVLHDLTLAARFAHALALLDRGRLVATGAPDEVLTAERLATVYRVSALAGHDGGEPWIVPWRRL